MESEHRCLGKINLPHSMITHNLALVSRFMEGKVVLEATPSFAQGCIEYTIICPKHFYFVPYEQAVPTYKLLITATHIGIENSKTNDLIYKKVKKWK